MASRKPKAKALSSAQSPIAITYCTNDESVYTCNACDQYGSGFTYHCSNCKYNLHVGCASLPETVEREDHEHPLILLYCTSCKGREDTAFICSVCEETVLEDLWVYYCRECDYGTHVYSCAAYEDQESNEEEEGEASTSPASRIKSLMKAQDEMAAMQLEARIMNDANEAALDLWDQPKRRYYW
ncbi:BnaC04g03660D [Brassica napus]|uniref:BnaC04g03660D protein n=1 Tax=Brassica napus TaxID=3708 RepID=A0A078FZP9_BRANA|nr:BnaC04g03660D [Brassica napus]